jgi:hypothetical protein
MTIPTRTRIPLIVVLVAMLVPACGGGDAGETTTTTAPGETTTSTQAPETTTTTTSEPATTTTTTEPASTTTSSLPGEPLDFGPVAHDDILNVRSGPGTSFTVVAKLAPTAGVVALGNARSVPDAIWYQVDTGTTTGWVSAAFVAIPGAVDDLTSTVVADLGSLPGAETMLDLGLIVADVFVSDEPPSRVRMSVAPSVGDLGEVTYDVVGLGDDSLAGFRLHVFATPSEGGEGFVLQSVEGQVFCLRSVTGDGTCV